VNIPPRILPFWNTFASTQSVDPTPRFFEAFHFDDNEPSANDLANLVLSGTKRATAGLVWSFENASMPLPKVGDLSVVTSWAGTPMCVIETQRVDIVPFEEVSADFAATEGEGDGSLQYWQQAHRSYFGRECQRIGREPNARMPVVCEHFAVIYRGSNEVAAFHQADLPPAGRLCQTLGVGMAFDEGLAERVRDVLRDSREIAERKMFGGLAFMVRGNMACGIVGDGLMLRLGADGAESALEHPHVRPMDFTGKPMTGMVFVGPGGLRGAALQRWVSRAVGFVGTLPPKG